MQKRQPIGCLGVMNYQDTPCVLLRIMVAWKP